MKIFRKLDNYLLHYYPSVWITRVHLFLPIGLGIAALLFFTNMALGWNPQNPMPDASVPIVLMIIPVLLYLVYWFVFQSRYNVAKSGGRMPVGYEYLNFFLYLLVFFVAFLIILAIPVSNYHKMKLGVDEQELRADITNLNQGSAFLNGGSVVFLENGRIEYYPVNFVEDYYYDGGYITYNDYPLNTPVTVTRDEALRLIDNYVTSYNKYTHYTIDKPAQAILADIEMHGYGYYDDYNYDEQWKIQYKLSQLNRGVAHGEWYGEFSSGWFWKIAMAIIAWLSLLVWIFKQMKLRHFVFGFIALLLTPLLVAIVGVLLFEVLGLREDENLIVIVLLAYAVVGFLAIRAYTMDTLNNTGYVMTLYLQVFLPLLPVFTWLYFWLDDSQWWQWDNLFNKLYWMGWIIGLLSILAFKPIYAKFRSLPAKN